MADADRNKPKLPKGAKDIGEPSGRKEFWSAGKSVGRTKQFWLDIETTGLGEGVVEFGPERWKEIVQKLDKETTLSGKIKKFKSFDEFKYFENIGLAQFVTYNRMGPQAGQGGMPPWPHGAGYTIWEDNFANTLLSKKYQISEFSRRRGIIKRSLEAASVGDAKTEFGVLSQFSKQLQKSTSWGRSKTIRGWNVWFDVFATQAFMFRHAAALDAAGFDPMALINATKRGALGVESMEEHYFDMLRWKGLKNPEWARENLRFGKMYAAKIGAEPGAPIPIMEDLARRAQGRGSLLRGRYGWKAELLEGIFDRHGAISSTLKGWKFPGGRSVADLDAHDAMRDIASEYALSRKFVHTNKAMSHYSSRWNIIKRRFPGKSEEQVVSALAMARAGLLGDQFTATGLRGSGYVKFMSRRGRIDEALKRSGGIWSAIEAQTPPVYKPGGPARRIRTPYGSYMRLLWKRDVSQELGEQVYRQVVSDVGEKLTQAKQAWSGLGKWGKIGIISAGAYIAYQAFGRRQETIDSNIPYNYLSGQQGSKVIDVPWSSPYEGMSTDDSNALEMMARATLFGAFGFGVMNLPGVVGRLPHGEKWKQRLALGGQFLEDITPFRVGRLFNIGSMWSSYMTGPTYNLPLQHLTHENLALSSIGKTYADVLGLEPGQFLDWVNSQKQRGMGSLLHTRVNANSPFMRIDMGDLGEFDVRMFDSTSRLGNTFGSIGAEHLQHRRVGFKEALRRKAHILSEAIPAGQTAPLRRILRGANYVAPGIVGPAVKRWASVPVWDSNPFRDLQRTQDFIDTNLLVPGYQRWDIGRRAHGFAREGLSTGYSTLRRFMSIFGYKMGNASTIGAMARETTKAGLVTAAAVGGFSMLNNSLGGALMDPFYNLYERAMLARASISDFTGLTTLRQQIPDVQGTAVFGVLGAAAGLGMATKFFSRTGYLYGHYRGIDRADAFRQNIWGRGEDSPFGRSLREEAYRAGNVKGTARLKSFLYDPEIYSAYGDTISWKHYAKWSSLRGRGKLAVGLLGAATALTLPFLLGSKHSRGELEEIYAGERDIEVKRGRWWELGNTPYEGGRTHYWRRHQVARRKLRAAEEVPGAGHTGLWGAIKTIVDPYWREKEAYYDRPYPITGPSFLADLPLVGPLAEGLVGRFIKPPKLMHTKAWTAGSPYEQYGEDLAPAPGMGGLPSPTPHDPYGLAAQIRESTYRITELAGLRGYLVQSQFFQSVFGGDMPYEQAAMLEPARLAPTITDTFWEADLGGQLGANEVYRRLFPRPERGTEVNPLRNRMPSWLPGDEYFVNFKVGDPYRKVRYGAERLPGAGYEALNPEVAGFHPEDYPAFHKYKILADVAPWAIQTRQMRSAAYRESRDQPARLEALDRIDRQMEAVKRKRDFKEYSFLAGQDTVTGTVQSVTRDGTIRLAEHPYHTFTMAGIGTGASAVADQLRRQNNMTKDEATRRAFQAQAERQALLSDMMIGKQVTVSTRKGGMNAPDVAGTFTMGGTNINRMLVSRGLAASEGGAPTTGGIMSLYGGAMEALGHFPQKIPGPWMLMTKFFNQADPMEAYRRDVLYGSESRFWDSPWENMIRPYIHQGISKLTLGEYIPAHVEEQREMDMYLDRIKFLKYAEGGEKARARRTMAGVNVYGSEMLINSALPHREKPFFEAFRQETDPAARSRILSMVSSDMQRALVGQWTKQYAQAHGRSVQGNNDIGEAVRMARFQLRRMGRPVPPQNWSGSDPAIDWDDIKAVLVANEGQDTHDYNIWDDRTNSLLRKPYVYGAVEGLTSRRMPTHLNKMSFGVGGHFMPVETFSHTQRNMFNVHNNVNYANWENDQYEGFIDRLRGY